MSGFGYAAVVTLTAGIVAVLCIAVRDRDVPTVVNTVLSIAVIYLPLVTILGLGSPVGETIAPALSVWLATAGFLHSLGMVGLYEQLWWWDHLTHTVSAAFVAAVSYAVLDVVDPRLTVFGLQAGEPAALTLIFTVWVGVFWELVELWAREIGELFDIEPVLVHYGWRDTAYDLAFDAVGATVVVVADIRVFYPITGQYPGFTRTAFGWTVALTAFGSVILILGILFDS